uniref:Uncharacterized protein n=1 Tax=Caenorhabditis japonica TaxID=281687 RepID=A0A8R1IGI7_CAEJA
MREETKRSRVCGQRLSPKRRRQAAFLSVERIIFVKTNRSLFNPVLSDDDDDVGLATYSQHVYTCFGN